MSPGHALRIIGLGVLAFLELQRAVGPGTLTRAGLLDLRGLVPPSQAIGVGVVLPALLFGGLFLRATRDLARAPCAAMGELAVLALVSVLLVSDGLYLVAALAALILAERLALRWLAAQILLTSLLLLLVHAVGAAPASRPLLSARLAFATDLVDLAVWQFFAFAVGAVAARQTRHRRETAELNADLLASRQLVAESSRIAERARVSSALDERLGARLGDLATGLDLVAREADDGLAQILAKARRQVLTLLADLRQATHAFGAEQELDLLRALRLLSTTSHDPRIHLHMPSSLGPPHTARTHALFRAAQEAITNAVKHSAAANLWLEVRRESRGLVLVARDDGRGAKEAQPGSGLSGIRERAAALGGTMAVETADGQGFRLEVSIPDAWPPGCAGGHAPSG